MYLELMQEFQNHPDFAGELGNIYFSKGQTELAVRAYSEAFFRLLKNNDHERAEQVLGIIYNIDQEQAALLNEYLTR
jgi:tetratricopeptide (TPR) repeat protein